MKVFIQYLKQNWVSIIVLCLFLSMNFLPGWLQIRIIVINLLSFFISSFILIRKANLKHYNNQKSLVSDFMKSGGVMVIAAIVVFGVFISIYDLYVFWKSPLKKEFESMQQQERDNKIKKLGL